MSGQMPAGATWQLQCFLGSTVFGDIEDADEVSDSIKPSDIRLVRIVAVGGPPWLGPTEPVKERQEVSIPNQ